MNGRSLARGAVSAIVAAGIGLSGGVVAQAATTGPAPSPSPGAALATLKAKCNQQIQDRLSALRADSSFVSSSSLLTSDHRSDLLGQINADESGLTALGTKIQADTTFEQAKADCETIVTGYRVYVLEQPRMHEVIAADGVTSADAAFETLIPQLQELINVSTKGDKAAAQAALNDLRSKVTASETSISGVAASVINQQPSGYPGNKVVLTSAAQNIKTSKGDLDGARADVTKVLNGLGH